MFLLNDCVSFVLLISYLYYLIYIKLARIKILQKHISKLKPNLTKFIKN